MDSEKSELNSIAAQFVNSGSPESGRRLQVFCIDSAADNTASADALHSFG
jgi:hypothetical protein